MNDLSNKKVNFVNSMVSDQFEIYHVKDVVDRHQTLYHYHDFYEIHATLAGKATFYLDGNQFEIEAGTVLLIDRNDLHRIVSQSTEIFERVYIFITPEFLQTFSTKNTNLESCFDLIDSRKSKVLKIKPDMLKKMLQFIDSEPSDNMFGSDIIYQQQLIQYIIFLNKLVLSSKYEREPTVLMQNKRIEEMINYISQNLDHSLDLDEMEKTFFVSKYYITREFKKYTGLTYHKFVQKKKLLYAKRLLKTYRSSADIYQKCGFNSYSHFLKSFKKEFGITPKEYIEKEAKTQRIYYQND
ncbi:AraC family transcriptional regulator [Enterococcus columbae]|uniref:HTH araC/xylS-type domain-containing protein n=1 Tax=Enterococcus columbae DSM 7374 = ATCC 51263 TaxID=1121865 RepID=S1N674_9ENTE|nr:AraC family transcriptional regulator [Enterococcus columbae]EOT44334.1 hypothetical protein OMW_00390 [Enterococcus columbae DSM 7374 = ATCC 51263]EOW84492.1 hypothetical protein I568_00988 [Enterococcus columbae DSM 7374 = ATCC 51263]